MSSKEPLVVFHKNCYDGFTAAWVAHQYLRSGREPELRGMDYTDEPPADEDVRDRDVYVVDFSFKRPVCERIRSLASALKILDHHKTAEAELSELSYAEFDMERSGAGMTWDYFHAPESRPWLVDYVEDRDLWRFNLWHSMEVNAFIACTPMTLGDWDYLSQVGPEMAAQLGEGALAFEQMCARKAAETARVVRFEGHDVPFVNTQYQLASVTAGLLAELAPFAVAWFQKADGTFQYSLRSRGEGGADVSEIAKKYGGGGHRNAAGFTLDRLLTPVVVVIGKDAK
jgi:oligoribonuclease NrnB/cAMP/cGMP phosphodiesterase (DHH superfamily)